MSELSIEVATATFGYGPSPVLDEVDLSLSPGQFAVLTGANGSGKSTLLKLCVGLIQASRGTVLVLGGDPASPEIRRRVGYAPQGLRMASSLPVSVTEVVAAGLAPAKGIFRAMGRKDWTRVNAAIDSVGLGDLSGECLFELSGGQQQRAILARALVAEPEILLLDEPTTGIDRRLRPALAAELRRRADDGVTVVTVSHDPDDFHEVSDRILALEDGKLRQITHDEFHAHIGEGSTR